MFSTGTTFITSSDIQGVTEAQILSYYLGVTEVPCVINSPLRKDCHPSLGIYSKDGFRIRFKDYATGECGGIYDLLMRLWNTNYTGVVTRIYKDMVKFKGACKVSVSDINITIHSTYKKNSSLECKVREWLPHDLEYWQSYGIPKEWLEFADVFPISHKIVTKDGRKFVFPADKYAYVFVERKEGRVSLKIYQPFNKNGYKWANKNDGSVIGLWTKIPEKGECVCICSSLKDALCLWANSGIPCIFLQGEGYTMSETAVKVLKSRFKTIYVCFDNDSAGLEDAEKLCTTWGFKNVVLPHFDEGKDISDLMKVKGEEKFSTVLAPLFFTS